MKERDENNEDEIVFRFMEERDVKGVIEILSTEEFYSKAEGFPENFEKGLMKTAREAKEKGFDKYSNTLVAATQEKAVARLIMDNNYPPYSELAGLIVHPNYRGKGIGTKLVREFIIFAQRYGCNILYVIAKNNVRVHRFYTKLGFKPAMLHGFEKDEKDIVMFQFLEGTSQQEFIHNHPLSGFSASGSPIRFHDQSLYEMMWEDPITGSHIAYYLRGKRHSAMPRIAGISIQENNIALDAWIKEETSEIDLDHEGRFRLFLTNKANEPFSAKAGYIIPEGAIIKGIDLSKEMTLKREDETNRELRLKIGPGFNVPPLSFRTVLVSCNIKLDKLRSPLLLSAGFEKNR